MMKQQSVEDGAVSDIATNELRAHAKRVKTALEIEEIKVILKPQSTSRKHINHVLALPHMDLY